MSNLTKPYVYETNTYNVTDAKSNCARLMDALEQNKVSVKKIENTVDEINQNIDTRGYSTSWTVFGNSLNDFINEYTTSASTKLDGMFSKEAMNMNVFRASAGKVWVHQVGDSKFGVNSYEVNSSVLTNRSSAATSTFESAANTGIVTLTNAANNKEYSVNTLADGGAIDTAADTITISSHGLNTGDKLKYAINGANPAGGLTAGATYTVIYVDKNTISLDDANGDAVNLTGIAGDQSGDAADKFTLQHAAGDIISILGLEDATAKSLLEGKKFKIQSMDGAVMTLHLGTSSHDAIDAVNEAVIFSSYGAGTATSTKSQSKKVSVKDDTGKIFTAFYLPGVHVFLDDYKTLEVQLLEKKARLDMDTLDNPPEVSLSEYRISPRRLDSNDAFEENPSTEADLETHLDKFLNPNLNNQTTYNDADSKSVHAERLSLVNRLDQIMTVIKSVLLSPNLNM